MNDLEQLYIRKIQKLKLHEIIQILEDYRTSFKYPKQIVKKDKSILISLKVPESLLNEFKEVCQKKNIKYQSQIKYLMKKWLND